MSANTKLVDYGIQTEKSDWRAHVCWTVGRVFYYPTDSGVRAVESGDYRDAPAHQVFNGSLVQTASGKLVPPAEIEGCIARKIPDNLKAQFPIAKSDPPTLKGELAVEIVKAMLLCGLMPAMIPMSEEQGDLDLQIEGVDIIVTASVRLQVKCDFEGGPLEWGGSGSLYLQTAECNPHGLH